MPEPPSSEQWVTKKLDHLEKLCHEFSRLPAKDTLHAMYADTEDIYQFLMRGGMFDGPPDVIRRTLALLWRIRTAVDWIYPNAERLLRRQRKFIYGRYRKVLMPPGHR